MKRFGLTLVPCGYFDYSIVRNLCGWLVYPSGGDSIIIMTVDCQTAVRCAVTERAVIPLFILDNNYSLYSGKLLDLMNQFAVLSLWATSGYRNDLSCK